MEKLYISSDKYSIAERSTKRGKVYDIRFRVINENGKEINKRISGYTSKTNAKLAYLEFIAKNCTLVKRNPLKCKKNLANGKESLRFDILVPLYIQSMANQNKESTIYDRKNILNNILLPYFKNIVITDITEKALYTWQDELWNKTNPKTGKFYSYNRLSAIRGTLSAFLSWCELRYSVQNILPKIKKPKRRTQKTVMQFWTREEFEKFISVVDKPRYRAIFYTLYFTGRRKGEVLALNSDDVKNDYIIFDKTYSRKTSDEKGYVITTTKNEKRNKTFISKPLKTALAEYEPQTPFFFGGEDPIHENTVAHAFDAYIKKAKVKRIRIHDLRHSFVSMCIHLGASVYVVADLIGDTVEQVLKTYGHLYEEDKAKIINSIQ